jgi:hypothetical protein
LVAVLGANRSGSADRSSYRAPISLHGFVFSDETVTCLIDDHYFAARTLALLALSG